MRQSGIMEDRMKREIRKLMIHINSLGKGGAERVVSLLVPRFVQDNVEVVVATEWEEKEEYPLDEKARRVHAGLSAGEEKASVLQKQYFRVRNLRRIIRKEKPDIILSFCVKANYRAIMASLGMDIPVVISVRNDPKVDYVGGAKPLMNRILLNRAAGCVFQTQEAREFFDLSLQRKSTIICNPVNEKYLKAERKPAAKKILYVGRIVEQKNPMLLVKAFEGLLQQYPDYHLYFYGEGLEDDSLEKILKYLEEPLPERKRAKENIHFMGLSDALEKEMADGAMFVLPSNYEGMPNALMEAMALGLPVISTDCPCGGSRYWISQGETGLLTPVGEVDKLTQAMEWYISHPDRAERMGINARRRLKEASLEQVYEQWKNYLNHVIIGKNQTR